MKLLPIGIDSFEEVMTGGYYFVDKSLLIKDVRLLGGKVKLITRPRRFGKTLNMDMIRLFYSIDGEDLFEGLKIWKEKAFIEDHYHRYPVVFVSFREIKSTDWEKAEKMLRSRLMRVLVNHLEGIESASSLIEMYRSGEEPYEYILTDLMEVLYKHHKRKVILLIDEYDVPIESAYIHRDRDPEYYEKMVDFMRGLLTSALKSNPYLEFAVITGVYRVAKEALFSGLNNLQEYTVFSSYMATRFGFMEEEVYELLKHYGLEGDVEAVREWYNGYVFGDVEGIYNPWSVIKYVHERIGGADIERALQPYWINSSGNELIIKQIESNPSLQKDLDRLMSGQEILVRIDPFLSLREIDRHPHGIWTLLTSGGYLNAKYAHARKYRVFIPNKEVDEFYKLSVMDWMKKKVRVDMGEFWEALDKAVVEGNAEDFANLLKIYLENSLSYFDVGYSDAERVYKAFVLGMLSMGTDGYVVETEAESGYGRVDVAVYPKDRRFGRYAIVMELKKAESERALETKAQEALEQIKEKRYTAKYENLGFEIIRVGMAFYGKEVVVRYES